MLKTRLIPTLLWKDYGLFKGEKFNSWRRIGSIHPAIKIFNSRLVDELILLDISASIDNKSIDFVAVSEFSLDCTVPLTVGGGIKSPEQVENLLLSGADKVSINTANYSTPDLIGNIASRFGRQCVVASIDVKKVESNSWLCFSHSSKFSTNIEVVEWAKELEKRGAGELLITSIDNDGCMNGYDLDLIKRVTDSVSIPVIASGGAGNYQHLVEAITIGGASAVAAGSIFNFTEQTPIEAKRYMHSFGIPVRILQ